MANAWCSYGDTGGADTGIIGEEQGTRREQRVKNVFTAQAVLRVIWDKRYEVISDMLYQNDGKGAAYPNEVAACPISFEIVPVQARPQQGADMSNGVVAYEEGLLTINYSSNQQSYIETLEPSTEMRKLDHNKFQWGNPATGPVLKEETPTMAIRRLMYTVAYKRMKDLPDDFDRLIGCVNDVRYDANSLSRSWGAETMLYVPGSATRNSYQIITPDNPEPIDTKYDFWDYTCRWKINLGDISWNKFYRADSTTGGSEHEDRYSYEPMYMKLPDGSVREYKPYTPKSMEFLLPEWPAP